jgi:hypothetical protein
MADAWINTNEVEDVIGSIRHVVRTAHFTQEDHLAYKWVLLALHSALQGACVCHLTTTAHPLGAITQRNAVEWTDFFEKSRTNPGAKRPKTYLMALPELLKAVRKERSAGDQRAESAVAISDEELRLLKHFNDNIRNQFVHFEPMGWSIEITGIASLVELIVRIIEGILDAGWAFRHADDDQRLELQTHLKSLAAIDWLKMASDH